MARHRISEKVTYNGKTDFTVPVSDPSKLKLGEEYTVKRIYSAGSHCEIWLNEIEGEFNAEWFDSLKFKEEFYSKLKEKGEVKFLLTPEKYVTTAAGKMVGSQQELVDFVFKNKLILDAKHLIIRMASISTKARKTKDISE